MSFSNPLLFRFEKLARFECLIHKVEENKGATPPVRVPATRQRKAFKLPVDTPYRERRLDTQRVFLYNDKPIR